VSPATAYPRTLVVGRGFDQTSGAGITLTSLFGGWPKSRLAAAASAGETLDTTVCDNYYALGSEEAHWAWPLSRLARSVPSGPVPQSGGDAGGAARGGARADGLAPGDMGGMSVARRAFWRSLTASGAEHFLMRRHGSPRLARWIDSFRPEVAYTCLESLPLIGFVDDLVTHFELPLVIHMMDDWPSVPEHEGVLGPVTRRVIDRSLRGLMAKASCTMGISQYMCEVFGKRYGREFLPFHNVLDSRSWSVPPRSEWKSGSPFRLVYTGRVGKANEAALRDIAGVIARLASDGLPVSLEIYALARAPFAPGTWPDSPAVKVLPAVAYEQVPRVLVEADLLVLPLDFSDRDLAYARYSMPTKVAEYLASGTPILVYCPEDTAVTHSARSAGWGAVVGTKDPAALARTVAKLASDEAARERLGRAALRVSETDNDLTRVRAEFAHALDEASVTRRRVRGREGAAL